MTFTYTLSRIKTEALHWVRARVGDTIRDKSLVEDQEISAALNDHGLTDTSDPVSNRSAIYEAAADVCRVIAARLAHDSQITITEVGVVKSTAFSSYMRLAKDFESEAKVEDGPSEEIDSLDYNVSRFGEDKSEYVGDLV